MERVEEKLKKVAPVMGEKKARALWAMYLAGDNQQKRDAENLIKMLADKYAGDDYKGEILLPPPPKLKSLGEYPLGTVIYPDKPYSLFGLNDEDLIKHVGIFGMTGSGKTNLCYLLLQHLMEKDKPFLVLDWKKNYRDLLAKEPFKGLLVFTAGTASSPFYFNPLIPPPGTPAKIWLKKLIEVLALSYFLGAGVMHLYQKAIDHVYKSFGLYKGTPLQYPTFHDVEAYLKKQSVRGREMLWMASAKRTASSLTFGAMDRVVNIRQPIPIEKLLEKPVVIEIDALTDANKTFLIDALTLWIYHYRLQEGKRETFKHALILEEAHHVLLRRTQERQGTETIMDTTIRMCRELGQAIILLDQHPSLVSIPALGNTNCTVSMTLKHGKDVEAISKAMLLEHHQRRFLGQLKLGQAIVKHGRHPQPFLIHVPLFQIHKGFITDKRIQENMGQYSFDSTLNQAHIEQSGTIPAFPRKDILPPMAEMMLRDIAQNPLVSMVKRYKQLGISIGDGNRRKELLLKRKLVRPVKVNGRKLLDLTEKGIKYLEEQGVALNFSATSGGIEHEYWKKEVKKALQKRGYQVQEEKDDVDLVAEKDGERLAIEIETGKSDFLGNIIKNLDRGYTKIISVATNKPALLKIKEALKKSTFIPGEQVAVMSVKDLLYEPKAL